MYGIITPDTIYDLDCLYEHGNIVCVLGALPPIITEVVFGPVSVWLQDSGMGCACRHTERHLHRSCFYFVSQIFNNVICMKISNVLQKNSKQTEDENWLSKW